MAISVSLVTGIFPTALVSFPVAHNTIAAITAAVPMTTVLSACVTKATVLLEKMRA